MQANTLHFDDSLNITCYTCKHKHNGGYKFPCEHEYCPKCFHQLLFNKCIHNIPDSPTITITCSCDNSNASKISLEEIYNVLSKSINDNTIIPLDPEQCLEHIAQPSSLFCKTCNNCSLIPKMFLVLRYLMVSYIWSGVSFGKPKMICTITGI